MWKNKCLNQLSLHLKSKKSEENKIKIKSVAIDVELKSLTLTVANLCTPYFGSDRAAGAFGRSFGFHGFDENRVIYVTHNL